VDPTEHGFRIAFRTWRVDYRIDEAAARVEVFAVASGYTAAALADGAVDKHEDKAVHRAFVAIFVEV
jgi:hypothetical protein